MADATSTVTVDGVEPSILVKLVNSSENPGRVKLVSDDSGTDRYIEKDSDTPVLITSSDLAVLGTVEIEIVDGDTPAVSAPVQPAAPAGKSAESVNPSPVNPSPGQSGQ